MIGGGIIPPFEVRRVTVLCHNCRKKTIALVATGDRPPRIKLCCRCTRESYDWEEDISAKHNGARMGRRDI